MFSEELANAVHEVRSHFKLFKRKIGLGSVIKNKDGDIGVVTAIGSVIKNKNEDAEAESTASFSVGTVYCICWVQIKGEVAESLEHFPASHLDEEEAIEL